MAASHCTLAPQLRSLRPMAAKNGSVAKDDGADADHEAELKATLQALLNTDCLTLKSYARSILMDANKTDENNDHDNKAEEIKLIEHQLLDLQFKKLANCYLIYRCR